MSCSIIRVENNNNEEHRSSS